MWGLNYGIDYTGGSLLELKFSEKRPSVAEVNTELADLNLGSLVTQPVDESGMILKFKNTDEASHQKILEKLSALVTPAENDNKLSASTTESSVLVGGIEQLRYDSVGPSIGQELKRKSITAVIVVLVAIVLYIGWTFRKVSKPVASWKYGISATIALFHDVIITLGVFSYLGRFYDVEISVAFVAAILTILGYSINDTIVVFDRIRENLPKSDEDFENTVNISVNQTIVRSINSSGTVLASLLAIYVFGGASIRDFALALIVGIFFGTYSSIFLASPILILWEKHWKN